MCVLKQFFVSMIFINDAIYCILITYLLLDTIILPDPGFVFQRYGGNVASTPARMDREEVVFKELYHPLGFVSPVHVRRHKLEFSLP
jgi:hypothetical protein